MTNPPPTTMPLWALPTVYALSLGLFVPGILKAASPMPILPSQSETSQ